MDSKLNICLSLCISYYKNQIIFTTKKVGSRYFEEFSETNTAGFSSIEFRIHEKNEVYNPSIGIHGQYPNFIIGNYHLEPYNNDDVEKNIDKFFSMLNLKTMLDIFKSNKLIFIIREPLKRTLSGFIEMVDGTLPYTLSETSDENIVNTINESVVTMIPFLYKDEHTSCWNSFLAQLIEDNDIVELARPKIIDLDNKSDMSIFPTSPAKPTNKNILKLWLRDGDQSKIDLLNNGISRLLEIETESYNKLLALKNY